MAVSRKTISKSQFDISPTKLLVVCCLCTWWLCLFTAGPARADLPPKPNIIFILADDLGYGDLGSYGQTIMQTPRLDQLANQGMRFTQFYSGACSCAPARCVLMTGFHTGHSTVRQNVSPNTPLRREDITMAEVLKRAEYSTALLGKWGLGGEDPNGNPLNIHAAPQNKGFDFAYGYLGHKPAHYYYPEYLCRNGVKEYIPENFGGATNVNSHDLFTDEAIDFVTNANQPFYLQLSYTVPHKYLIDCPLDPLYSGQGWPEIEKHFASMITRMDTDVGRIVDAVDARGIGSNTLVIFTSDNGPQQKEGHLVSFFDSNGPLRGKKFDLYEGGIREPFIARWTGTISAGTTSDHIGAFEDFLPTAAEIAGVPSPSGIDGISFLPALTGQGIQQQHTHLYWSHNDIRAVRWGDFKAVKIGTQLQLYDLSTDIAEQYDLAAQNPAVAAQMELLISASQGGITGVANPVMTLVGDVTQDSNNIYLMDFGDWTVGDDPITLNFQVRNDALSYSNLMEGQVDAVRLTDPRLSLQEGDYAYLVDGSNSDLFSVTFTPSSGEPIYSQYAVITGLKYIYGYDAINNPLTLYFGEKPAPADFDFDRDVDQEDFGFLQKCYSGYYPYTEGCDDADLNDDGMVEQNDFALLINCMGGSNNPPGC
ncbi:MAG: arylsulfatase [Planctomycetota bacterium]|jgi:arylsulfatase A-like enzyme